MTLFDLAGHRALVTGGSRGLGYSMADALLDAGAEVVIIGSHDSVLSSARDLARGASTCHGVVADLRSTDERRQGFAAAMDALDGRLDILVNAAGIQSRYPAEEFPLEAFEEVIDVNLTAVFELCQLAGRHMLDQRRGKIINIASLLSFFGGYTVPAYAASKGGVMQLTKALANEWAGRGVNVNAIAPGYMATEMNAALLADHARNTGITERIPAGRWGVGDDMKGPLLFLASTASDYVNGAILPVDGGYLGR
ncbi:MULTISPECIES: SDR family NAD(P)-dependent oxidoreductase [Halomonas]|uniref:SDR family NAD(P)-dependent oxidoreductase n=1 Tax=Halomonas TaxID=2745 RepID=UPI001C962E74|nr:MULTISPECIES: SDR family NAD(P)-dependent oxidoreductase [Halomonas]MBY6206653.1 SDR family NAD(P)-dependent oxidoreductase [Halomonas sp. DP3Y7-2]MBY6230184.1 SDR family NAD(P)-dependent oxidoreductase [Halomonas sp. DP3Y7-1]MCA0918314.1 SDR family NAD(P)-dependent oxidoreductase [Halomonas denitrificans]